VRIGDLSTPALVVDLTTFDRNVAVIGDRWPGESLRTHVKAFKSTALAQRLHDAGHPSFCCATVREMAGMARAGLGHDLLLANEVVDPARLAQLATLVDEGAARITVAVDSDATIAAAAHAGLDEVLIDVNVGLPRCGCSPADAGRLADAARGAGLTVRGVMGYEGHVTVIDDRAERAVATGEAMSWLTTAHDAVGGEVISGGSTTTWDINPVVTELQAGSFALMDTEFAQRNVPFGQAVAVLGTVLSVNHDGRFAVVDVGLKSLGMDHGNPTIEGATVWICSDEHTTYRSTPLASVDERAWVWPAHIDPTLALHERMHIVAGSLVTTDGTVDLDAEIIDEWPVDLRNW
jgi:D-serine deaminase-like pyridoxal phosphate-dependent protein